jgi:hypothetical protein
MDQLDVAVVVLAANELRDPGKNFAAFVQRTVQELDRIERTNPLDSRDVVRFTASQSFHLPEIQRFDLERFSKG